MNCWVNFASVQPIQSRPIQPYLIPVTIASSASNSFQTRPEDQVTRYDLRSSGYYISMINWCTLLGTSRQQQAVLLMQLIIESLREQLYNISIINELCLPILSIPSLFRLLGMGLKIRLFCLQPLPMKFGIWKRQKSKMVIGAVVLLRETIRDAEEKSGLQMSQISLTSLERCERYPPQISYLDNA